MTKMKDGFYVLQNKARNTTVTLNHGALAQDLIENESFVEVKGLSRLLHIYRQRLSSYVQPLISGAFILTLLYFLDLPDHNDFFFTLCGFIICFILILVRPDQ